MSSVLHLIDDDGELSKPLSTVKYLTESVDGDSSSIEAPSSAEAIPSHPQLRDIGCEYRVVAVFGGQSTGKSTLLNKLFGTSFATMNADTGRSQTTKGAFLQKSKNGKNVFVVDFEGTDGVERGEDQNFEKQLSLFALSIADVLLINMWANEVGRFNAANLSLLRTVFEVNLSLFAREDKRSDGRKPTLLFVMRDHTSGSVENLIKVVRGSLDKIWETVTKPAAFADSDIDSLFALRFVALAHYDLQKDQFIQQVDRLRLRFTDEAQAAACEEGGSADSQDFLLGGEGTVRNIPLDGLTPYLTSCWQAIRTHKDLDIPSQREMLARLRCGEISDAFTTAFADDVKRREKRMQDGLFTPNLSGVLRRASAKMVNRFRDDTKLYSSTVVETHLSELQASLKDLSANLLTAHSAKVAESLVRASDSDVQRVIDTAVDSILPKLAAEWFAKLEHQRGQAQASADRAAKLENKKGDEGKKSSSSNSRDKGEQLTAAHGQVDLKHIVRKFWTYIATEVSALTERFRRQITADAASNNDDEAKASAASSEEESSAISLLADDDAAASHQKAHTNASSTQSAKAEPDASEHASEHDGSEMAKELSFQPVAEVSAQLTLLDRVMKVLRGDDVCTSIALEELERAVKSKIGSRFATLTADAPNVMIRLFDKTLGHNPTDGSVRFLSTLQGLNAAFGPARASGMLFLAVAFVNRLHFTNADREDPVQNKLREILDEDYFLDFIPSNNAQTIIGSPIYPQTPSNTTANPTVATAVRLLLELIFIDDKNVLRAYELYNQHCDFTHKLQARQIESSSQNIPAWVWVALFFFGANEVYYLLTNPMLLIAFGAVAYFFGKHWIIAQWQKFEEVGPPSVVLPLKAVGLHARALYDQRVAPMISGKAKKD